jgi:transcriptional regulator with XRE-family HTH domain
MNDMGARREGNELGDFLRARRNDINPESVGLATAGRRRVSGLRREEVAQLASVSTDYYTRLEQGRVSGASAPTLEAIARALVLSPDQTSYLFTLAHKSSTTKVAGTPLVHPHTQRLLDNLVDTPALVMDRTMAIVAWNQLAAAFYTDFSALSLTERNLLRLTFLDPEVRRLYVDWESEARAGVAFLRMDAAQSPTDPALQALVGELSVRDENFRRWWASHQVAHKTFGTKHFHHPVAGDLILDWQILSCAEDADQFLLIMTAEAGSPSHQALRFLASWATAQPQTNLDRDPVDRSEGRRHR